MIVMNDFIYNLSDGKVEFKETEIIENAKSIDEAFKNSIDSMTKLGYKKVEFDNLKMFIKYNTESISMRTMTFVIFEEIETKTDVLDETLDDLENEIDDALSEVIDDEFVKLWTNFFK